VEAPAKENAVTGFIKLVSAYPPETRFFINAWCWGYESTSTAAIRIFGRKVHVDRYKHIIFTRLNDPLLASLRNAGVPSPGKVGQADLPPKGQQGGVLSMTREP